MIISIIFHSIPHIYKKIIFFKLPCWHFTVFSKGIN